MKHIFLLTSVFLFFLTAQAQLITEPIQTAKDTANGVFYALPKTLFNVEVTIRKKESQSGIYFQYAERFLGIKDFIQEDETNIEISDIRVHAKAVTDTAAIYVISSGKKGNNLHFEWTADGFLKSINMDQKTNSDRQIQNSESSTPEPNETPSRIWETKASSVFTKEMQQAVSTAKMAEIAANQIFSIREARLDLLRNEADQAPKDGKALELTLSEMNRMEQHYLELFKGKSIVTEYTTSFVYDPKKDTTEVLFRMSEKMGLLNKDNLGGAPIFISLKRLPCDSDRFRTEKTPSVKGIYYRVPGKALVQISNSDKTLFKSTFTINQFGSILGLSNDRFRAIELCPYTGQLIQLIR